MRGNRKMDKNFFWKNFSLGKELDIAGTFIYNGLKTFDCMENYYHEVDIFEFLYNISVGIERLEKIAVILIEHKAITDQKVFEQSLITHNHLDLLKRINLKYNCEFRNIHNSFVQLLSEFYKSMRYDRFILNENFSYDKERVAIISYIEKYLKVNINYNDPFHLTRVDTRTKRFIGKVIGKICTEIYEIIEREASSQNIYTYEIRTGTKASKIFLRREFDFLKENIVWKEILVYLLNTKNKTDLNKFISMIEPLDLDSGIISEYINVLQTDLNKQNFIDEIEELYYDVEDIKQRKKMLELINNPLIIFNNEG